MCCCSSRAHSNNFTCATRRTMVDSTFPRQRRSDWPFKKRSRIMNDFIAPSARENKVMHAAVAAAFLSSPFLELCACCATNSYYLCSGVYYCTCCHRISRVLHNDLSTARQWKWFSSADCLRAQICHWHKLTLNWNVGRARAIFHLQVPRRLFT